MDPQNTNTSILTTPVKQYFCILNSEQENMDFCDRQLNNVPLLEPGIYAFLIFSISDTLKILVLSTYKDHESCHWGGKIFAQTPLRNLISRHSQQSQSSQSANQSVSPSPEIRRTYSPLLFQQKRENQSSPLTPKEAGTLFMAKENRIGWWSYHSGSISRYESSYADNYPDWKTKVLKTNLPKLRFIKVKQAEDLLKKEYLESRFKPNGELLETQDPGTLLALMEETIGLFPWNDPAWDKSQLQVNMQASDQVVMPNSLMTIR